MENLSSNFWIIPLYLLSNLSFLFNLVCTPCTPLLSYSLTYDKAKHFATRFKMLPLVKSIVYTVKVPVEDVLAYIDREDEVVCLPICMDGKMQVIKEESFL